MLLCRRIEIVPPQEHVATAIRQNCPAIPQGCKEAAFTLWQSQCQPNAVITVKNSVRAGVGSYLKQNTEILDVRNGLSNTLRAILACGDGEILKIFNTKFYSILYQGSKNITQGRSLGSGSADSTGFQTSN